MPALSQMKLLINLARIDGSVAEREKNYIINIGRAHGIYPDELLPLLTQPHQVIVPNNLSASEKFDYIFSLVQLMKIDERMYKEELQFCSDIAASLGYEKDVMFDLLLRVKTGRMAEHEIADLKERTQKYLKK